MRDVAHLAGVSHQTVSRVVNDHPSVRSETRARVLAAMRALDYQPNVAARTLATNRSQTIGLVTFDTTLFGPSSMVHAIERAAREAGYFVSIASARELNVPSVHDAIRRLREQAVEGIITLAPVAAAWTALGRSLLDVPAHVPIVGMGIDAHAMPEVPMVAVDNAAGAGLATRHLIALGHRTVHHVAGPPEWPEARERMEGWQCALIDAGLPVPDRATFLRDADWMGIQRHVKILGLFCRLRYRDNKGHYLDDAPRFIGYLDEVLPRYRELAPLQQLLENRIKPALADLGAPMRVAR